MRAVVVDGTRMRWLQRPRIAPSLPPTNPTVTRRFARAARRASRMLADRPDVVMPTATSPGRPRASIWRARTREKSESLAIVVWTDVLGVRARAARDGRSAG